MRDMSTEQSTRATMNGTGTNTRRLESEQKPARSDTKDVSDYGSGPTRELVEKLHVGYHMRGNERRRAIAVVTGSLLAGVVEPGSPRRKHTT
jgi:hypothetical protein